MDFKYTQIDTFVSQFNSESNLSENLIGLRDRYFHLKSVGDNRDELK